MDVSAPATDIAGPRQHSTASGDGDFDCNICLDIAVDPVVTLCGHLYCSPCIHKWLMFEDENASPPSCPVCKASLSHDSLVHLYARGGSVPKPTPLSRGGRAGRPAPRHRYHVGYGGGFPSPSNSRPQLASSAAGGVLGVELYYASRYHRVGGTGGGWIVRRPERGAETLLRIWLFMLCSAALCLLLFS